LSALGGTGGSSLTRKCVSKATFFRERNKHGEERERRTKIVKGDRNRRAIKGEDALQWRVRRENALLRREV